VFVRAGAVLSLLPDDVDSLSPYAAELEDRRTVLAVAGDPGHRWSGSPGPELACRTATDEGSWTLELSAPRLFAWEVTAWIPEAPVEVDVDGPWSFAAGRLTCSPAGASTVVCARWAT
jgi:hypothetical protein